MVGRLGYVPCFEEFCGYYVCLCNEYGGVGGASGKEVCGELSEEGGYLWRSGHMGEYDCYSSREGHGCGVL